MVKGKQTRLIESLYKGEIKALVYKVYTGSDTTPHVKTYAILNDGFDTKIKLEELGQVDDNVISELKSFGYYDMDEIHELSLKKVA